MVCARVVPLSLARRRPPLAAILCDWVSKAAATAAGMVAMVPTTARDLLERSPWHMSKLALGDPALDQLLEGGIDMSSGITEIAGEAGAGVSRTMISPQALPSDRV